MFFGWPLKKNVNSCELHGASSNAANRTLLLMLAASILLIVWRVWSHGPSGHWATSDTASSAFHLVLWGELLDLIFSNHGIVAELWDVLPYFVVGLLLGGYLRTYKIAVKLQNSLRKYGVASVFLASFIGIITPLCACGTLTTAISLLFAGLPLAPVMALLVTSPLLSPSAFLLTLNDLGPEWTVIRTISAYAMGVFAGLVAHMLRNKGFNTKELFIEGAVVRGDFHDEDYPDERLRCNCREKFGNRVAVRTSNTFLIFLAKSAEMIWPVGKYILVGVAVGAVVERYMPYEWIYHLFGSKDPLSIVWVTLGSVPLFLHQISASSILFHIKSSLHGTLDSGAALAFIIGGPVTAVPTLALFWSVFKKRVFVMYLTVCLAGTMIIAYGAQSLIFVPGVDTGNALFRGVNSLSGGPSAVIEKKAAKVRIVLDTNGRSTIAVADADPISGQGSIVFDAGMNRLKEAARLDNLTYFGNVAQWLEEGSSGGQNRTILIYEMGGRDGVGGTVSPEITAALQQQGFTVKGTDRRQLPRLSAGVLADYNQIWFISGDSVTADSSLRTDEVTAITDAVAAGKGMLLVAGTGAGPNHTMSASNEIAARYGVTFGAYGENEDELKIATAAGFFTNTSALLGRILKFFHKA